MRESGRVLGAHLFHDQSIAVRARPGPQDRPAAPGGHRPEARSLAHAALTRLGGERARAVREPAAIAAGAAELVVRRWVDAPDRIATKRAVGLDVCPQRYLRVLGEQRMVAKGAPFASGIRRAQRIDEMDYRPLHWKSGSKYEQPFLHGSSPVNAGRFLTLRSGVGTAPSVFARYKPIIRGRGRKGRFISEKPRLGSSMKVAAPPVRCRARRVKRVARVV